MTPLPLRTSLTILYIGMLALLVTVLALFQHFTLQRQLDLDATNALEAKARGLHGYLRFRGGSTTLVYDQDDPDVSSFIHDATRYYRVYAAGSGRLLAQSPGFAALALDETPDQVAGFIRNPGLRDLWTDRGRLRVTSSVVVPTPGEIYLVQVGAMLDSIDATLAAFDRLLLWTILAGLACAAVVGRWLAGRALAPLSRLAVATRAIGITNLQERLPVRGAHDELDQVADAFNASLARVEVSVGEMRQFSAALAHELRTPLAILRGEAELALRQPLPADQLRDTLADQIDEFDRLTRLINQILTLARAEAGEIRTAGDPVDLTALTVAVVDQMEPVAAAHDVTLTRDASAGAMVKGDTGWLERLLLILLDNAIKFTPQGGRIAVGLACKDGSIEIAVQDSGIGMSPDVRAHLFERFYRADAQSRHTQGAGLGLALARWIVDRHGGTIDVVSQPDRGSTFRVSLPSLHGPGGPGGEASRSRPSSTSPSL